ncbi:membrane protein [Paenibacillus antibioticophila]|uniref:Membrane protein n=1 Tax=Paenibacillus antibioticophila TaxID=1274374 RepID=A0A919XTW8_9BACL|nr:tail protein X [Paenibacillus antibioticophila]GIO39077.1 membrane protein [Paenibacillus antibioticophila]
MTTYITIQGDTFDSISFRLFGTERFAVELMKANPEQLNTVVFGAGVVLTVPEIPAEQSDELPPWKREG